MSEQLKSKELFLTQYWGQKVLHVSEGAKVCQTVDGFFIDRFKDSGYLLLRTVDQLTDDEISLIGFDSKNEFDAYFKGVNVHDFLNLWVNHDQYQLLRSNGILLPFTYIDENGKPQTLQPDEIVQRGWAKIKENENTASNSK